jgi:hypothetical protein
VRATPNAPIVWKGDTGSGQTFVLRHLIVAAPSGKSIVKMKCESAFVESAIALFGLTAITP